MKQRQGPTWADTMWRNGRNVLSLEKKFTWLVKHFRYRLDGMKELCRVRTTHSRKDGKYQILRRIERGADVVPGYTSEKYNIFLILPFTFLTVITFLGEVKVLKSETWKIIFMWFYVIQVFVSKDTRDWDSFISSNNMDVTTETFSETKWKG